MTDFPPEPLASSREAVRQPIRWPWATAVLLCSCIGAVPACADLAEHLRSAKSPGVPPWALLALSVSALELAYLVYLVQLPRRSAFHCVAFALLIVAMAYASLLGLTLLANDDSRVLQWLGLGVSLGATRAWCFLMTSLHSAGALLVERYSPVR